MGNYKTLFLIALVVGFSSAQEWSWGAEEKAAAKVAPQESVPVVQQEVRRNPKLVEVAAAEFNEPLPLEPHSSIAEATESESVPRVAGSQEERDRQARFLGLSDTLCDWGIGVRCDNKIKKKGHGYPPTINSQYGAPTSFGAYDSNHGSSSYATDYATYNTYDTKVKGHHKGLKGQKKGTGFTDLVSGFLNSYTKPKGSKGYAPAKLPTYLPPSQPIGTYGAPAQPAYVIPKPAYSAPSYTAPKYEAPKFITPKPIYNAPKIDYVQPSYTPPVIVPQKPKAIYSHPKVTKVITHTVKPIVDATKVQHLHSHTHVYHGAQVIKPGEQGYVETHHAPNNGGYSSHFQKKSDDNSGSLVGSGTSFVSSNLGSSNTFSHGSAGFGSNLQGSGSVNIHHNVNPANTQPLHEATVSGVNSGFSSHSQLATNNHNFQQQSTFGTSFQPSAIETGFKPSTTIEDMLNQNHISNFARTLYRTDCHCVAEQYCSADSIIPKIGDLRHLIDARNRKSVVYSNATDSAENVTSTDEQDSYDYAYDTTELPYYYEEEEIAAPADTTSEPLVEARVERKRRDTEETDKVEENFSDVEGRQLTGYTPGATGCGVGTVCCKRPVYSPARTLPVCGISHNENIHGRIKTKHEGVGQASFGEYPWQAAMLKRSGGDMVYVCGATLVSDQYLITAAHCVKELDASILKVRVGEWDVRDKSEFYPHVELQVSGIYSHPKFYEGNLENDIAILRVAQRINFSKYPHIMPACLPQRNADFTGKVCRITGWGKDGWGAEGNFQAILKETEVPVVRKDICQQILRGTKLGPSYNLHQGMMCAGGEENKDACKGDGGGPLVCKGTSGEYHLAGVVSWGIGCGERNIPGVYVDVPYYLDWIESIIRN